MEEDNVNNKEEIDEKGFTKISADELIEKFREAKKYPQKECLLKDLVFDLEGEQKFDFNNLLSRADAIFESSGIKKLNIKLKFENCIFKSPIFFWKLSFDYIPPLLFSSCTIENEVKFEGCKFKELNFYGLNGIPSESKKSPQGNLVINGCTADKVFLFKANNSGIHLDQNEIGLLALQGCVELNNLSISQTNIKENLSIRECNLELFRYILLKGQDYKVYIQDSNFNIRIEIADGIIDNNFIFRNCYMKNLKFSDSILDDGQFINCNFDDYILYDEQEMFGNEMKTYEQYNIVLYQYRALEKNFDLCKNYEEAGKFHKRQFEVQMKFANWFGLKKYILILYKWSSVYGENYALSFAWFFSVLLIFSGLYLISGLDIVSNANDFDNSKKSITQIKCTDSVFNADRWKYIKKSLFYSLSNTLPIRKDIESIRPSNDTTRVLATIEITIQSIILTLFVIALRRKFKR